MTRQRQQVALLAGLGVVCVLVYVRALRPAATSPAAIVPPAAQSAVSPSASPEAMPVAATREAQHAYAQTLVWSRDPFLRGGAQGSTGLNLSGIIWDRVHPMAMINGVPVTIGEDVEGFRVVDIQPDRVTLTDGTTTHQLRLAP